MCKRHLPIHHLTGYAVIELIIPLAVARQAAHQAEARQPIEMTGDVLSGDQCLNNAKIEGFSDNTGSLQRLLDGSRQSIDA